MKSAQYRPCAPRYLWRQLTPEQRAELLAWRKENQRPWHSPPHRPNFGRLSFHLSAACFEHVPHIGYSPERMDSFSKALLDVFAEFAQSTVAWCVLPNHYHALVQTDNVLRLLHEIGRLHGRASHTWNGEDGTRARKVFFRATERAMRSERHFWATVNYIRDNPVHHRYVRLWTDWPWGNAREFLEAVGREEAERIWKAHPLGDYGAKWDPAEM